MVRRSPGFSAVVILTLALGIGANTAIFSILNALLLRNLPVSEPRRLVQLNGVYRNAGTIPLSSPMYQQLAENQRVFSEMFAWSGDQSRNVQIDSRLLLPTIRRVSGNYYGALGVSPLLGRLIGAEDAAHAPGSSASFVPSAVKARTKKATLMVGTWPHTCRSWRSLPQECLLERVW